MIKITTVSHCGGKKTTWECSKRRHIEIAIEESLSKDTEIAGYDDHRGDFDSEFYPKFDDEGNQISGSSRVSFEDAVTWFGRDVQSIKVDGL